MTHMSPPGETRARPMVILGALLFLVALVLLASVLVRLVLSAELPWLGLSSPHQDGPSAATEMPTPTARQVSLPAVSAGGTPSPTVTASPVPTTPVPSPAPATATSTGTPTVGASPGPSLPRPTRAPRLTPWPTLARTPTARP
jgi:hypothetical protein